MSEGESEELFGTTAKSHRKLKPSESYLPNVADRVVKTYTITKKESESFGIVIVGGVGSKCGGIFIKRISPFGVCGLDGKLVVGDQILEMNGENMLEKTHEEAVELFRKCKTELHIEVYRMDESRQLKKNRPHGRIYTGNFREEPIILEHKSLPRN